MTSPEEEEMSTILSHFSMPSMPSSASESLLTQSQYAKVIFHDLLPIYPTDADIWCRYTVTAGVNVRHGDRVALYRVGWTSVHDHVQFEMAPVPSDEQLKENHKDDSEFQVLFKACSLPKDTSEFYQLCYVNVDSSVCGASVPFQFRRPADDELCEVEEQEGLLVIRSRTAINEDKLRDATNLIEELEKKNMEHERQIADLHVIKDKLGRRLDDLAHVERHEMRLQEDIQALDSERTDLSLKLGSSTHRIEQMSTLVDTLNAEKSTLAAQLRAECCKRRTDSERLTAQIDDLQQMLDASAQSKEMAAQALHCEQSKVMKLNIEHDKYKFRCSSLEEEKSLLQSEVARWQENVTELKDQVENNLELLKTKTHSNELLSKILEKKVQEKAELERQLKEVVASGQREAAKVTERDEQIVRLVQSLERAEADVKSAKEEVDSLRQSVTDSISHIRPDQELTAARKKITAYELNVKQLCQRLKEEYDRGKSTQEELDVAKLEIARLASVTPMTSMNASASDVPPSYDSLRIDVGSEDGLAVSGHGILLEEAALQGSEAVVSSLAQVKNLLATAEECNSALKTSLSLIEARHSETSNAEPSMTSAKIVAMEQARADAQLALAQSCTRQDEMHHRLQQMTRRLAEIETESAAQQREIETLGEENKAETIDLHYLNERMQTLQQEVLRDDSFQGMDRESEDLEKLDRMTRRAHDLEMRAAESSARLYDAQQIYLVLGSEKQGLEAEQAALLQRVEQEEANRMQLEKRAEGAEAELQAAKQIALQAQQDVQAQQNTQAHTATAYRLNMTSEAERAGFSLLSDSARASSAERGEGFSLLSDAASAASLPSDGGDHQRQKSQAGWEQYLASKAENVRQTCGSGEAELHLRLELAAAEYRKVYIEKLKAEKKLARMQNKCSNGSVSSESSTADVSASSRAYVCPICSATFPLTEPERFTRHFEDHLS